VNSKSINFLLCALCELRGKISIYAIGAGILNKKHQSSFSPHSLQKSASGKFTFPQFGHDLVAGFSSVGWPQREQNFAVGVRFFEQRAHCSKTKSWWPQSGQNLELAGMELAHSGHLDSG
jgi:hypothetical protein